MVLYKYYSGIHVEIWIKRQCLRL